MGFTLTELSSTSSENDLFPGPRPELSAGADAESARRSISAGSASRPLSGDVARRSRALVTFALAVLFILLMSGRALAQDSGAKTDTDGDGLSDSAERSSHGTDPFAADTDGDGLPDGVEIELGTDALAHDSDGDGVSDAAEYLAGADPLVRTDSPFGVVVTQVANGSNTQDQGDLVGKTTATVSPGLETDVALNSLAFDESLMGGRSPLFALLVSLAAALAVGMAFLLAVVPSRDSVHRDP